MIPPHLFFQIYLPLLQQNDCTPPKCGKLSEYTDSAHTEVEDLSSRCMNGSNGSNGSDRCGQDRFILHALPVAGLPISHDRLDKMKLVHNCTILIILPSTKKIMLKFMFKIITDYTNLSKRQLQGRLGSRLCLSITVDTIQK